MGVGAWMIVHGLVQMLIVEIRKSVQWAWALASKCMMSS